MYICNNCNTEFDEPEITYETHGLDTPPYEKVYVCPCCYISDFEEVDENNDDD